MLRAALIAAFLALAPPVSAQSPAIADEDRAVALDDAFIRLKRAPSREDADAAEAEIWRLWSTGPTADATARLTDAIAAIHADDLNGAEAMLDELLRDEPGFMEAWNQRAFARFLKGDRTGSLADIRETLDREPRHFGALSGRARIEAGMMREGDAMRTMGEVGAVHPWMARRSVIPAEPPVAAPGEDL